MTTTNDSILPSHSRSLGIWALAIPAAAGVLSGFISAWSSSRASMVRQQDAIVQLQKDVDAAHLEAQKVGDERLLWIKQLSVQQKQDHDRILVLEGKVR
jgi:hypothetical protein